MMRIYIPINLINKTNAPIFTNSTITEILSPRLNVSKTLETKRQTKYCLMSPSENRKIILNSQHKHIYTWC